MSHSLAVCTLSSLLVVSTCYRSTVSAAPTSNWVRVASDVGLTFQSAYYPTRKPISIGPNASGGFSDDLALVLPERVGVDALMAQSNKIVFSADVDFEKNSTIYADEDLISFDPQYASLSMFMDGSAIGIPASADLDAASFSGDDDVLFSLDVTATLPGAGVVGDDDVVLYNGSSLSNAYDGSSDLVIPERCDIDALHLDSNGILFYSLDQTAVMNWTTGTHNDVWSYDSGLGGNPTLAFAMGNLEQRSDLIGLDEPIDSDGDWLTDFEELTGEDEGASTFPGSTYPVSPNGYVSSPTAFDSDGDGMSDGKEGVAGTNPMNSNDLLRLTKIEHVGTGARKITWSSVSGKEYDVYDTTDIASGFTNVTASGLTAGGGETSYTSTAGEVDFYRVGIHLP